MLSQHPEKAYTCDVCKKIFLTKQTLMDHKVQFKFSVVLFNI